MRPSVLSRRDRERSPYGYSSEHQGRLCLINIGQNSRRVQLTRKLSSISERIKHLSSYFVARLVAFGSQ